MERIGNEDEEMGRTAPERKRVIFGCVRLNGAVETEATDIEVPSRSSGSQTDAGEVRAGTGLTGRDGLAGKS